MPYVKPLTGEVTRRVGMTLADLGILRWDRERQAIAAMFGDNFSYSWGQDWQSPSIVMYDREHNCVGIPTKTGIVTDGMRRQLWDYPHNNPFYSTILPCDFIQVNGVWYVAAMVTKGLGNELRTVFWQSEDLVEWVKTDPYLALIHPGHPGNVMLTFDQIGDYVYIFGTGGLARNKPIWLWRNKVSEFPHGWWEPYGRMGSEWSWGNSNEHSPLIGGSYGELCFRYIQGNCVLSFFDAGAYRQTALCAVNPTDFIDSKLVNRVDYALGQQFPQLYGGYISPTSRLNESGGMDFLVSQWDTSDNTPYHTVVIADTLHAKGPLLADDPFPPSSTGPEPEEPEEPIVPEPEEPVDTAQELYEQMVKELAASGSTPITTVDGRRLTLREAVAEMYVETCMPDTLKGMPVDPRTAVPLLDHVRSMRWEGLFTQAMVLQIADKFGLDADKIYADVKGSLG